MSKNKVRIIKKFFIIFLCSLILSTTILSDFSKANTVKAIVGVDDACVLIAMLAMFGIYVSYTWVTDGNNALDLYDELEDTYNTKRFEVIQGGAGGEPDDNNDDNNNDDVPPDFETLYNSALTKGQLELTTQIASCLAVGALSVWDKMYNFGSTLAEERYKNELGGLPDSCFTPDTLAIFTPGISSSSFVVYMRNSSNNHNRMVFVKDSSGVFTCVTLDGYSPKAYRVEEDGTLVDANGFGYVYSYKFKGEKFYIKERSSYGNFFSTFPILKADSYIDYAKYDWDFIYDYIIGK